MTSRLKSASETHIRQEEWETAGKRQKKTIHKPFTSIYNGNYISTLLQNVAQ